MNSLYFLPSSYLERIAQIKGENFEEIYEKYKRIFFEIPFGADEYIPVASDNSKHGRRLLLLEGKTPEVYSGKLWGHESVEYIGWMDYLFTTPLWDWWINPLFPRASYRGKNYSIILTESVAPNVLESMCASIEQEGYGVRERVNLDSVSLGCRRNLNRFEKMVMGVLPQKLAYDAQRISSLINSGDFQEVCFILRGGRFISSLLGLPEAMVRYLNPSAGEEYKVSVRSIFVDDCLGKARALKKIIDVCSTGFHFAALDITLPSCEYEKEFPQIAFHLPDSRLNIFGCRLFEENSPMCGTALSDACGTYTENIVRQKLVKRIRMLMLSSPTEISQIIDKTLLEICNFNKNGNE